MISPIESGVTFGPYEEEDCYLIEKSTVVSKLSGIKIAEFVLSKENSLFIVEAKSSIPRLTNKEDSDRFFSEIHDKLLNTLTITFNGIVGRNDRVKGELPANIKLIRIDKVDVSLLLVIPDVPMEQLPPMTDKIRSVMRLVMKTWGIKDFQVLVLNKDLLTKHGLKI